MADLTTILTNIANSFITHSAYDVVGVYTQEFTQVFKGARPIKASVKPNDKLMDQPLETGATVTDHRILLPVEIELALFLQSEDYKNAYSQIKQLYTAGTLLVVQTKADVFYNQVISSMPHEESPDTFDAITMVIKMREVQFAKTQATLVAREAKDSTTVKKGQQQPNTTPSKPAPTQSVLKQWFGS